MGGGGGGRGWKAQGRRVDAIHSGREPGSTGFDPKTVWWKSGCVVELWWRGGIMALNLKNQDVDRLAAEVAAMAKETKTEAVRKSLLERKLRLASAQGSLKRSERAKGILEEFRASIPSELLGKRLTREEEDEILGYGPGGV